MVSFRDEQTVPGEERSSIQERQRDRILKHDLSFGPPSSYPAKQAALVWFACNRAHSFRHLPNPIKDSLATTSRLKISVHRFEKFLLLGREVAIAPRFNFALAGKWWHLVQGSHGVQDFRADRNML